MPSSRTLLLRSVRRLVVIANVVLSTPILLTLMMEALSSSETLVLTRTTRLSILEDCILHVPCCFCSVYYETEHTGLSGLPGCNQMSNQLWAGSVGRYSDLYVWPLSKQTGSKVARPVFFWVSDMYQSSLSALRWRKRGVVSTAGLVQWCLIVKPILLSWLRMEIRKIVSKSQAADALFKSF
jgi:hypothetical protein